MLTWDRCPSPCPHGTVATPHAHMEPLHLHMLIQDLCSSSCPHGTVAAPHALTGPLLLLKLTWDRCSTSCSYRIVAAPHAHTAPLQLLMPSRDRCCSSNSHGTVAAPHAQTRPLQFLIPTRDRGSYSWPHGTSSCRQQMRSISNNCMCTVKQPSIPQYFYFHVFSNKSVEKLSSKILPAEIEMKKKKPSFPKSLLSLSLRLVIKSTSCAFFPPALPLFTTDKL